MVVGLAFADLDVVVGLGFWISAWWWVLGFGWWSGSPEWLILILILVDFGCWVCCLQFGGVVVVAGFWMMEWVTEVEKRRKKEK